MSLSESILDNNTPEEPQAPARQDRPAPSIRQPFRLEDNQTQQLTHALDGVLLIESKDVRESVRGRVIVFRGKLAGDAETLYPMIEDRFKALGFTPMLERRNGIDVVLAIEGLLTGREMKVRPWLHILLLVATIITTTVVGASFQGRTFERIMWQLERGNLGYLWTVIQSGAPFALTLLLILGVHEMGHYIAARRHHVSVTPPFFIPLPLQGSLGTLGAVIFMRSPIKNRKALFDVGISGPLAGFVVALVAFVVSLRLQPYATYNQFFYSAFSSEQIGMPLLLQWLGQIFRPDIANLPMFVARQPVALAAWLGMFVTVLNLLPVGQLDGGHIMYTLFGRFAWTLAYIALGLMIFFGLNGIPTLLIYAMLSVLTGLLHPPPNNDITPLDWRRKALGFATIVLFFLIATPVPFPPIRTF